MLSPQEFIVDDFSGGITDYSLTAQPNQMSECVNFLINPNKRLYMVPGSQIYDDLYYRLPSGNERVAALYSSTALDNLFISTSRKIWYDDATAFTELTGPTSNPAFNSGTTSDFVSWAEYADQMFVTNTSYSKPIKVYIDGSNDLQVRTAGMPALATAPTVTSSGGSGNNYLYAFLYYYEYTVGTTTFADFGPTTLKTLSNAGAPNTNTVNITAIPVISNGSTLNYDTTTIKVHIYRTTNNGVVFYKVGEVTNGTTTYNDTTSDATLVNNLLLYTNGGVLDNNEPPKCKYLHIVNGVCYYGNVQEGSEVFSNRVYQSVQDDPDSVPAENYIDVLDEITGISSYSDNPLIFTKGHVYRLNGQYNELGQGQVTFEDITKTIGCKSHNSIVQTRFGVFWAGDDGFYWTDGFQFKKVSDSINERYKELVSTDTRGSRIYGAFDKKDNRVYWACTDDDNNGDNNIFYTLDLRWGIRDDSSFTVRTNGDDFSPTAIAFFGGQLIRGDSRGYIFKHDEAYTTDPKINTATTPNNWTTKAIVPVYTSSVIDFGAPYIRKWVSKILLTLDNESNVSIQIIGINDNTFKEHDLYEIRFRSSIIWGDPEPIWGNDEILWNAADLIEEMRRFPAKYLRCNRKQIKITQSFSNIYKSDDVCTATIDNLINTATLTDPSNFDWPSNVEDYYISFESDNYTKNYLITEWTNNVITFVNPQFTAPSGTQKWVIRGNPKGEVINVVAYTIYYAPLSNQSFKTYRVEQDSSGNNA